MPSEKKNCKRSGSECGCAPPPFSTSSKRLEMVELYPVPLIHHSSRSLYVAANNVFI